MKKLVASCIIASHASPLLRTFFLVASLLASCVGVARDRASLGRSHLGTAFDSGLRTRPWKFKGLGVAPFPVSSKSAELQAWFEETERSFRWCLKMEPENAMVYFGLARRGLNWFSSGTGNDPHLVRFRDFLNEAVKRKDQVKLRERLYIEAWDAAWGKTGDDARKEIISRLQNICVQFPDDLEAKCHLSYFNIGQGSQLANDVLIQQILAVNPMHPGAHHARIHNWDDIDGAQAVATVCGKVPSGLERCRFRPCIDARCDGFEPQCNAQCGESEARTGVQSCRAVRARP